MRIRTISYGAILQSGKDGEWWQLHKFERMIACSHPNPKTGSHFHSYPAWIEIA